MRVASPCRARPAGALRALALGVVVLLVACHGNTVSPPGTPVVTLGGASNTPEFASYIAAIDVINLVRSDGTTVSPLVVPETIDFAKVSDLAELVEAPAVPDGTYTSATLTLDFQNAQVWINQNGTPVRATVTNASGGAIPTFAVTVTFDPTNPLVIKQGVSQRLYVSFDLAASNSITTGTTPTVVVQPFVVLSPAPVDNTVMRARGLFVTAQTASSNYIQNTRPFYDLQTALGAVTVNIGPTTYFNIDGVAYTGTAGLSAMAGLQINTPTAAYGTLADLSGVTPSMNATEVYVGTGLENPIAETLTGVVSARSGNSVTLLGATLFVPTTAISLGSFFYIGSAPVTVGSNTTVTHDGVATSGLSIADVSVGQQLTVFGLGTFDTTTGVLTAFDATSGLLRLGSSRLWGTLNSATMGNASLDVLSFGNFPPAVFNFAGTGAGGQNANPAAYSVNTGTVDVTAFAAGTLLQVDGFVTPFGTAPPDFTAQSITAASTTTQQLVVEWINGGSTAPFSTNGSGGLTVNLADANLGTIHYIRTGPATLDLKSLAATPLITTTGADPANLQLAVGSTALKTGMSVYNSASGFASAVASAFNGTNKIYRLVAYGHYNAANNSFVAGRIFVALHE